MNGQVVSVQQICTCNEIIHWSQGDCWERHPTLNLLLRSSSARISMKGGSSPDLAASKAASLAAA